MARKLIADIRPGDSVDQPFLVQSCQLRTQRNGAFFLDLELMDRSGVVSAKMWDATQELFDSFDEGDFVRAKARGETYRHKLQLVLTALEPIDPDQVDPEDFLPRTKKDVAALVARVREIAATMEDGHLRALLEAFLGDADFLERFQRAPAAVEIHHAWLGGLLEHTLATAEMALWVAGAYPNLSRDLLVAGALLHDVGKVEEFDWSRGFRYTDAGGLVGHLPLGAMMIERRARQLDSFPEPLLQQLQHLVLSHHGQHAYGSPVLPATAEAAALHYIDNLDARLAAFDKAMLDDQDEHSAWTQWNRIFERRLFKGRP